MENFNKGNAAFIREDYYGALEFYNQSIKEDGDNFDALAFRCQTYYKINNFTGGLADADKSIALALDNYRGYYLRGIGNFYSEKFDLAVQDFSEALKKTTHGFEKDLVQPWLNKATVESGKEVKVEATENKKEAAPVEEKKVEVKEEKKVEVTEEKMEVDKKPEEKKTETPATRGPVTSAKKIVFDWYQNISHIYIDIKAKNVDEASVQKEILAKSVDISFPTSDDTDYNLNVDLFDDIIPEESVISFYKVKLELKLKKKTEGKQWPTLETSELTATTQAVTSSTPVYPTSSKNKKNWSQIDRDIEKEMKQDKPEGDEALNGLFKEIYKNASEETRRAMIKSYQTSGGTVLSTNWDEVASKDYEGKDRPDPPKGQQWAKNDQVNLRLI